MDDEEEKEYHETMTKSGKEYLEMIEKAKEARKKTPYIFGMLVFGALGIALIILGIYWLSLPPVSSNSFLSGYPTPAVCTELVAIGWLFLVIGIGIYCWLALSQPQKSAGATHNS